MQVDYQTDAHCIQHNNHLKSEIICSLRKYDYTVKERTKPLALLLMCFNLAELLTSGLTFKSKSQNS